MKISLKRIFILTTMLIFIKICISAYLSYTDLSTSQRVENDLMIGHMIHSHMRLNAVDSIKNRHIFIKDFNLINQNIGIKKFLTMTVTSIKPRGLVTFQGRTLSSQMLQAFTRQLQNNHSLTVAAFYPNTRLYVTYQLKGINEQTWMTSLSVILLGFAIILIAWWLIFFYYNHILPQDLLNALKHNTPGAGTARLKAKIQAFYEEKNLMLSALSHDIKTPLTEAMLKLELLEDQNSAISIQKNLEDINQIVKSSLDFSQSEEKIEVTPINIFSIIKPISEAYKSSSFQVNITASTKTALINADILFIRRMLQNIINNAKTYATVLNIHIETDHQHLKVSFNDNGPGVPQSALKQLGTPYFRVDASRSRNTGGTGLGLAIIRKIAKLHNGSVNFSNGPKEGFLVELKIPLADHSKTSNLNP